MKTLWVCTALAAATLPAQAQDVHRQLEAHEHGRGTLNIAMEGNVVAMALAVPGADIVGFEHAARTQAQTQAIDDAKAQLGRPLDLFVVNDNAGCHVVEATVLVVGPEAHDAHDGATDEHGHAEEKEHQDEHDHADETGHQDKHAHDEHGHDEHGHGEHGHGEHGHDEHAHDEHGHDEHAHDEHAHDEHGHGEHGHDDHDTALGEDHSEFRGDYRVACSRPDAIDTVTFVYFDRFPGAQSLEVNVITERGQKRYEVERGAAAITLKGMI